VLLDALYGAREVFEEWVDRAGRGTRRRFVDLYTCCGGTDAASRTLAARARALGASVFDDDSGGGDPTPEALAHDLVFVRVPHAHDELPRALTRSVVAAAGFAPLRAP
jgi:hypothetical protein